MDDGQDDEGEEVLDEEDEDGEGVLHVAVWPDLYTHGVAGPGQGDPLQRLEHQHWRGDGEGDQPNREIDKSHFCMSHFSWKSVIDLSNGEPSINCYCSYSTGWHQYVSSLHRRHQLAGGETEVPLATVQTLDQGGRDAHQSRGDARDAEGQNVDVLRRPVDGLAWTEPDITEKCF